ncbi:MAG: uncharacterized protein QOI41_4012 [Myxococcales bacterium]|nr:uncharacterized protein [Myxococcales bacterium]
MPPVRTSVFAVFMGIFPACTSPQIGPQKTATATATESPPPSPAPALASAPAPALALAPAPAPAPASSPVVARARLEVARAVTYDPSWFPIAYPNGDPSPDKGVCTDVVIRSLRMTGVDLQQLVHEDILRHPAAYATVTRPDRNIDHRRVSPLLVYLRAHATALPRSFDDASLARWQPGDVVVWSFRPCPSCSPDHVGIVSDRKGPRGIPLVIHNIGPTPSEDDRLDEWTVLGHFRVTS